MKERIKFDPQQYSHSAKEEMIPIHGKEQIIDMLRVADPEFREILLRRLEKRDQKLARELRRML